MGLIKFFKRLFDDKPNEYIAGKEISETFIGKNLTNYNIYHPKHYNIGNDLVNLLIKPGQCIDDISDIYENLNKEFLKYNINFSIDNYFTFRGEWYRRFVVNQNSKTSNECKKVYNRDSKGRFKKKGI